MSADATSEITAGLRCSCNACVNAPLIDRQMWMRVMPLCPTCGNKRCPKGTHHDNECSGSNEPGQAGSIYA